MANKEIIGFLIFFEVERMEGIGTSLLKRHQRDALAKTGDRCNEFIVMNFTIQLLTIFYLKHEALFLFLFFYLLMAF